MTYSIIIILILKPILWLIFPEFFVQIQVKNPLTWQHIVILSWNRCELFSSLHGLQRSLPNVWQPGIVLSAFHCCDLSSILCSPNTWGAAKIESQRNIPTDLSGTEGNVQWGISLWKVSAEQSLTSVCVLPSAWHSLSAKIFLVSPNIAATQRCSGFCPHFILLLPFMTLGQRGKKRWSTRGSGSFSRVSQLLQTAKWSCSLGEVALSH